jgi:TolB-like protein/Tfp pilus assembly protein PilF
VIFTRSAHRPYRLKSRAPHEIARVICEEEPQRPSTGLIYEDNLVPTGTDEHRTLAYIYQARRSVSLAALQQELLGDLERIVLKALRKDPAERYQSATALADDITRYLEGKPVSAPAYARLSLLGSEPAAVRSLAVLPLRLLSSAASADTGDKYLSVGLADAIITRLSGIRSLAVRPTSAVLRYGNDAPDPFQAGRELAVDYALDGRIRIAGARIRVSLQLLDVASGISVWASQFDEQFVDILELEDSISAQVADALLPLLRADEQQQLNKRGTNNAAAFEAYLRGRFYWNTFTEEGFAKAIQYFQHAVSLAPDYALAYTGIADYYNFLGVYAVLPFAEASAKAKEAALKAVVLDNTLAESYSALGFAVLMHDFDWDLAGQHFRRAVELNPNYATGRLWYGSYLGLIGRFEEGFVQARQALNLDPLTPMVHHTMNWMLYYARRYEESLAGTRRLIATEPQYGMGYLFHCLVLSHTGQYSEAFAAGQRAIELLGRSPYTLVWLASAYAAAGQHEQAYALLEEIERMKAVRYVSPYLVAMIYSNLGEVEQAFAKLEEALAIRDARLLWLGVDPQFDRLRHDPRLHNLLRHTQNPLAAHTSVVAQEQAKPEKVTSLAVLPFKLLGAPTGSNTGDEYLGIGLADALISRLSKVQRFLLRPTSSVLCCGDCTDSFVAGRELKVDYVVDGTIRRVGERVRITAQLLNIGDISTRWAEQYNEKLTDVLELEDSIASQVAAALIPQLTGEERLRLEKRGTNSPAAYEAYLRGRYHWNQFTPDSLPKALAAFQKAVALDPNYALAQVGLADFYLWANIYGIIPSAEATPLAEAAAHRALQLDDRLGEAYASLGLVNSNRRNWAESERLYHQALELNPSYMHTHEWYAALLVGLGKFAAGIEEIKRAEQLDPLSLRTKTLVAWTLYQTQRFDDALAKGREIIDLDKNYPQGYAQIALNQLALGRAEDAVVNLQKFDVMIPNSALAKYQLCFALVAAGRQTAARTVLEEMKTLATSTYVKPFFLAMAHVALDERDTAFAYFEKSMAESEPWLLWLGTEPMLAGLHNDPRFLVLLNRANLSLVQ